VVFFFVTFLPLTVVVTFFVTFVTRKR